MPSEPQGTPSVAPQAISVTMAAETEGGGDLATAHKLIAELRRDISALKNLQKNKAHTEQSKTEQNDATMKTFLEKCIATLSSWITSQTFYQGAYAVFSPVEDANLRAVFARLVYAVVASVIAPLVSWMLRDQATVGETLYKDFLKLVKASTTMLFAWAWKDFVSALLTNWNHDFWDELVVAIVYTLILACTEMLPIYRSSKKAVEKGGAGVSLLAYYAILPSQVGLAVGYAWNQVAVYIINLIQAEVASPNIKFAAQLIYYLLASSVIVYITLTWAKKKDELAARAKEAAESSEAAENGDNEGVSAAIVDMEHHAQDFERLAGTILVTSLSFVYAWAMSDTLNDLFFVLMLSCSGATACSQGSNMAYAMLVSIILASCVMGLKNEKRRSEWSKTYQVLQVNAMSLTVGWAWSNFASVTISQTDSTIQGNLDEGLFFLLFMIVSWACLGFLYHIFMRERRALKRQRKEEAQAYGIEYSI